MKTISPLLLRPVDKTRRDDATFMATVAAVAVDPATLSYEELVAAALQADNEATRNLVDDVRQVLTFA